MLINYLKVSINLYNNTIFYGFFIFILNLETFKVFDITGSGEISKEIMTKLLQSISKGIDKAGNTNLPFPFDTKEGIEEWVNTAYNEIDRISGVMNWKAFLVIAKSSGWSLSLFTLGCYLPSEEKSIDMNFPLSPPSSSSKMVPKRIRIKSGGKPKTPTRDDNMDNSSTSDSSLLEEIAKLKEELVNSKKKEALLTRKVKKLKQELNELREKTLSEDEWTDSDAENEEVTLVQAEETTEEQNERLITQVKTLQDGLKNFMEENRVLRRDNDELSEQNESLKMLARKLKTSELPPEENDLIETPSETKDEMLKQIYDYHAILSWQLQKERIVHPDGASNAPPPPVNVKRIDEIMKRGDFIQNWKKRLAIATDSAIYYFGEPPKPQGVIVLKSIRGVKESTDPGCMPNTLDILTPERVWVISFATKQIQQFWQGFLEKKAQENRDRISAAQERKRKAEERAKKEAIRRNAAQERARQAKLPQRDLWD